MLKKHLLTLLFVVFIGIGFLHAESQSLSTNGIPTPMSQTYSYKDPFLAGVLSWVMPGAGQIYAQAYTKGSVFIFANLMEKTSMVLLLLYLNNNYKDPSTGISWNELKSKDRALIISYLLLSTSLKIYNSIDAVFTAERYNQSRLGIKMGFYLAPSLSRDDQAWTQSGIQLIWQKRL